MVADALVHHPTVAHYLRFVATTAGRDKLLRTLQYFSRFYAWYLLRTNAPSRLIVPWEAIKKQFGLSRKLLRVGKNVEHLKAAAVAADAKGMDPVLKYCAVGRQLGYGTYLSVDMITYLDAAGIRPSPAAKRLQQEAYKAWLAGIACNTIAGFYTLWQLRQTEQNLDISSGEKAVESKKLQRYSYLETAKKRTIVNNVYRERNATNLQLISDLCDLTVPMTALGYVTLDDGIVGLAGTLSSLIGLWTTWKKTA
ncbi:MAG: Peroxisomal membrane protein PMP27 [Icmadophila ericetorum]|nr:Peroxisomal membrane protein PMP27 [Icmadophila ericetorum]